ncbi:MAG: hydroxymethylglutaryl-CoA reductase [Chitinophagales bacterium]
MLPKLPYSKTNDYTDEQAEFRRKTVEAETNTSFQHIQKYSFHPEKVSGNIENFSGVVQVPLGFAGPLLVNGEAAKGEFYVPMATTEGTLVASYNRGMKIARLAGGITTCVVDDRMNRAPVFIFKNAQYAREFGKWVTANFNEIKVKAEGTTSFGKLLDIGQYALGKMRWLRFNYSTGDAAGQNMVTKATRHACNWILDQNPEGIENFSLAANFDTDKKHSMLNAMQTRGKRVIAEITLSKQLMEEVLHISPQKLFALRQLSSTGAFMSGSVSNGAHFANGITALFIATGQDVANVAESSAGFYYGEILENGDYYYSITIPALIVATYGGGVGLPTQRECLEIMDCYGSGKVNKLAEIIAAVVLCGELSLGAAVAADEWVSSHEQYGRNR